MQSLKIILKHILELRTRMKTLVSFSAYSTLKMEAIYSSETLVDIQLTTRCYIPEVR
jgi:hypothetical protein